MCASHCYAACLPPQVHWFNLSFLVLYSLTQGRVTNSLHFIVPKQASGYVYMTPSMQFFLWYFFLSCLYVQGVVIRIRMGDGTLRRVEIDGQEITSHDSLRSFLYTEGIISSSTPTKLKVKGEVLTDGDTTEIKRDDTFVWKAGEIVEVIEVYLMFL